jgi:hypothetical protein
MVVIAGIRVPSKARHYVRRTIPVTTVLVVAKSGAPAIIVA